MIPMRSSTYCAAAFWRRRVSRTYEHKSARTNPVRAARCTPRPVLAQTGVHDVPRCTAALDAAAIHLLSDTRVARARPMDLDRRDRGAAAEAGIRGWFPRCGVGTGTR